MMTDHVKAWQCIGCGKIEASQTCVGICQYHKVELVYAHEHREMITRMQATIDTMTSLVRQIAWSTPRNGEWERSYRALQEQAHRALTEISDTAKR